MSYPLKIGSESEFQALRQWLMECEYTEEAVCQRLGIASIYDFKTLREGRKSSYEVSDRLDTLIRLLMDEEALDRATLSHQLGEDGVQAMEALLLLKSLSGDASRVFADAVLYPQEGLFIASDRTFLVDVGHGASLPEDVVYASITKNTGRFVSILPGDPCENLLELCAGTGIAAMIGAARYAKHSWACDLSARCTHFAEFNRRLNGLGNLTALQGDLYHPVEGLKFDRIVAHPPYVPAEEQKLMFRDGGQDGEQILRSIVVGLPDYLCPGGRFYALTLATDREGETLEQRIRKWLGEAESDFDVYLVYNDAERRPDSILQAVLDAKGKLGELGPRSKVYEQLKVETILYGVITVERHERARVPLTARCKKSRAAGSDVVEWFRNWQSASAAAEFPSRLMSARPQLANSLTLTVTHTVQGGQLTPAEFRMRSEHPLNSDARLEPWVAVLVGACDGSRTVRELFGYLKKQEVITAEMSQAEFGGVMKVLLESGFLEIPEFPLPALPGPALKSSAIAVQ